MNEEKTAETRASEMGWVPQETFRGDPERWIDAETFVKRGEELMPLLRANNKKLQEELQGVKHSLAETRDLLKASADSIDALKEFNSKAVREQAKEKRGEIVEAIKQARDAGDVDSEMVLTDQLKEQTDAIKAAEKPVTNGAAAPVSDFSKTPDWTEWAAENEWFGQDKRKTALALGIAEELRTDGEKILGKAFLDKVTAEVNKVFGEPVRAMNKVEGAGRSSGGNGSGGERSKSFADLPSEARAACEKQSDRLVGPGRAFKSKEEWRRHYVVKYFEEA